MEFFFALIIGFLFGIGTYLLFQEHLLKLALGFSLYTHAVHLLLITMGGFDIEKKAPILKKNAPGLSYMDPIPPDIILTSIVISFGVTALYLVVIYLTSRENKKVHISEL